MKNNFKMLFLTLGAMTLLFTCQKDDVSNAENVEQTTIQSEFKISKIRMSEINSNVSLKTKLDKLTEKTKGQENIDTEGRTVISTEHGFSINADYASYIESDDGSYHSYTFAIERDVETDALENLVLSLQTNGSYKASLITYDITAEEKENLFNGINVELEEKVSSMDIDAGDLTSEIFNKAADCAGYVLWESCSSGDHNSTTGYSQCQPCCYSIDRIYYGCGFPGGSPTGGPGDGNTGSGNPSSGTNTGGSTGSGTGSTTGGTPGSGSSGTPVVTTPTLPPPPAYLKIIACINSPSSPDEDDETVLTEQMQNWLEGQPKTVVNPMSDYLEANACSEEAQALIFLSIENQVSIDALIYVIENEQDYRNQMSEDELNLFDTLSNEQQLLYLVSAKQAQDETNELFSTSCERYNGKGDAFRHAYWNALSSQRIGVGLTNQLTTRHENKPSTYSYNSKENEMDLFNNQVGRNIVYNGMTNLMLMQQAIQDAFDNGHLRYLNNQASNCRATFSSTLIPTNQ